MATSHRTVQILQFCIGVSSAMNPKTVFRLATIAVEGRDPRRVREDADTGMKLNEYLGEGLEL